MKIVVCRQPQTKTIAEFQSSGKVVGFGTGDCASNLLMIKEGATHRVWSVLTSKVVAETSLIPDDAGNLVFSEWSVAYTTQHGVYNIVWHPLNDQSIVLLCKSLNVHSIAMSAQHVCALERGGKLMWVWEHRLIDSGNVAATPIRIDGDSPSIVPGCINHARLGTEPTKTLKTLAPVSAASRVGALSGSSRNVRWIESDHNTGRPLVVTAAPFDLSRGATNLCRTSIPTAARGRLDTTDFEQPLHHASLPNGAQCTVFWKHLEDGSHQQCMIVSSTNKVHKGFVKLYEISTPSTIAGVSSNGSTNEFGLLLDSGKYATLQAF